ncbi:Flagellar basal body rod protein FlgB (plasmid) [Janthinobacterium sp. HH102]|uniref:flagellar basal body rod protein FlgB n=3 Tax=unclassified Janthinobacterium TaxID=2610881 RepID=UPI00187BAC35|nr:flagellar basal body rod protein FlgB [Janthinobacterium sp. HH102]QOU76384.1 Flagellar basal body rod protein FlgB [Janthinobacterium sp. HH102]
MEIVRAKEADSDVFWEKSLSIYAKRLELIASNIANADTPHYKARDVDFQAALSQAMRQPEAQSKGDQNFRSVLPNDPFPILYRVPSQASADNNTVDMDVERAAFAETAIRYELAVQKVAHEYKEMSELFKSLPY